MITSKLLTRRNKRTVKISHQGNSGYSVVIAAVPVDGRVKQLFPAIITEKAVNYLKFEILGKMPKRGLWVHMVVI